MCSGCMQQGLHAVWWWAVEPPAHGSAWYALAATSPWTVKSYGTNMQYTVNTQKPPIPARKQESLTHARTVSHYGKFTSACKTQA
jgi:hypothetical protein